MPPVPRSAAALPGSCPPYSATSGASSEVSSHPMAADDGGATPELLVHGVGGTTPQEMPAGSRTVRITGDGTAAVHRRAEDVHAESSGDRGGPAGARGVLLVQPHLGQRRARPVAAAPALHGRQSRPLDAARGERGRQDPAVLRAAGTARRADPDRAADRRRLRGRARPRRLAVRGGGTVHGEAGGRPAGGRAAHSWLGFLAPERHGWWSEPGRRLALGALVPTGLVVLLWYLSHRT